MSKHDITNILRKVLESVGMPDSYYSIGEYKEGAVCIEQNEKGYVVYDAERAKRNEEKEYKLFGVAAYDVISRIAMTKKDEKYLQKEVFDEIMKDATWFHWSGITPAISDKAAELTRLACEAAKRHGVTVSVDLNFRKKLWTKEKAQSIMRPLMQYVDVCIGNEEDAELCLGFKPDADVEGGETNAEGYKGIFEAMAKEFGFKYVISTLRESFSATHNGWKAMIYNGEEFYESKRYDINPIIDRVGGGDSFSGGVIHGLLTMPNQGEALEFAVAASALKHTIPGDFNLVSVDEVMSLAGGNANGRVQR